MRKGIIFLLAASTLFGLGFVGQTQKVEAAETTYEKATSISVGDTVVLVCEAKKMELKSISTTSTKYGNGVAYDSTPDGVYPLTVVTGSSAGTYALQASNNSYLYWTSGNSLATNTALNANTSWKITFANNGDAIILNAKDSTRKLRWNASSPRFACYTSDQTAVQFYKLVNLDCDHTYGEVETPNQSFKVSDATCTSPAVYYKECTLCHNEKIEETYTYGEALGHNYENGECTRCGTVDESITPSDRVLSLFTDYYNEGSYTKYSVLNTNKMADAEVKKYFHAGADTKYRKTVYTPDGLKMTTSDTKDGEYTNESVYKNEGGKVVHTGLGGDYTVNKESVEDWFVTLKDFVDASTTDWTYKNGVYSHDLVEATATSEDDLTRMAREFVAPMWLAPNANNFAYAAFTKLTVEEVDDILVMKLYVDNGDILTEGSDNVFSQVTISKESESLSTLATFEFGANGNAKHEDGDSLGSSKSYTSGSYTLSLTGMTNVYGPAYDETGISCIKIGSSKAVGSFSFTVPEEVEKVIINVAKYKANDTKITVNGNSYTLTKSSNDGQYEAIEVVTSSTKTVNFATVTGGVRCMIDSIEYHK